MIFLNIARAELLPEFLEHRLQQFRGRHGNRSKLRLTPRAFNQSVLADILVPLCIRALHRQACEPCYCFTPSCQNKNEYTSVNSSICLVSGFPAPCPAFDSIRNNIGRVWLAPFFASSCISAAIFFACIGSTRVSVSAVINKIAGYSVPAFTR